MSKRLTKKEKETVTKLEHLWCEMYGSKLTQQENFGKIFYGQADLSKSYLYGDTVTLGVNWGSIGTSAKETALKQAENIANAVKRGDEVAVELRKLGYKVKWEKDERVR